MANPPSIPPGSTETATVGAPPATGTTWMLEKSIEKIDGLRRGADELTAPEVEPAVLPLGSDF